MSTSANFATSDESETNSDPAKDGTSATGEHRLNDIARVGDYAQRPLTNCTPAQWDALEARAVACMRAQLVRYHLHGGMDNAADYDRARNSWALIVMNRERLAGKPQKS